MLKEIIDANIEVHTVMAEDYNTAEPHYRPENRAQVLDQLKRLREISGGKLLDVGCGTGFIIDLAKSMFDEVHGVDVTQAMLDRVDVSSGNITLHKVSAENMPFSDASFDIVTSYAFIHHLYRYEDVLKEIYRVLRPGGIVYIDLEPNRDFWKAMTDIENNKDLIHETLSVKVLKELQSVLHTGERVEDQYKIAKSVFDNAEYTKTILGGIDTGEFENAARALGYSSCETTYLWYLGQGAVMHTISFEASAMIEQYLRDVLPLSKHLFKYLRFVLKK